MLKYIIIREETGEERAFFCMAPTKHVELALTHQAYRPGRTIMAAAFVEWVDGEARTYGWSDSLSLRARPEDAKFLTTFAKCTADVAAVSIGRLTA